MVYSKSTWRLLHTPPAAGAWNMAVDEAILESSGRGDSTPTLRLYAWNPPCLSLGIGQPVNDIDLTKLAAFGWDLVRRPTGGRAILHTDELTYSVIGSQDDPRLAGGVLESYRRLSLAFLAAMNILGVDAQAKEIKSQRLNGGQENPVCFEVPSNFEITVSDKKIIGSAQARRQNGVLQHGSLPIFGDISRITCALKYPDEMSRIKAVERIQERATTLESALGYPIDWEDAAQAIIRGVRTELNLELHPGSLTPEEGAQAHELYLTKYNHSNWTNKT